MRRLRILPVLIVLILGPLEAGAQTKATKEEIAAAFVGKTAMFSGGGQATYGADRSYKFQGSSSVSGTYDILEGQVCVTFRGGNYRCDTITKDGASFVLINRMGNKFPITFK